MCVRRFIIGLSVCAVCVTMASPRAFAGPLNPPPGPVAPTSKTLAEVEPRIAVNATNTPGDADSLFRITQPGSYYLTGNVNGVAGRTGIEIAADSVTLDLGGFHVVGVAGALVGVGDAANVTRVGITVRNGTVTDWPSGGVRFYKLASSRLHRYQDLTVRNCGAAGFECRDHSTFINCESSGNVGAGFNVADGPLPVLRGVVQYWGRV